MPVRADCKVGPDAKVIEPANLYGCELGQKAFVGPFCEVQIDAKVGEGSRISSHSFVCSGVEVGKSCFIGHGVMFTNDKFSDTEMMANLTGT